MTNLLCLLLGVSLPLVAVLLAARRALRPVAAAAAYRNLAWRLGLEADTRGEALHGVLEGRELFVGTTPETAGPRVRGFIELRRPLCMGLVVRPRSMTERLRSRAQRRPTAGVIGEPALDEQLVVVARDASRARMLFDDAVRGALTALRRRWPHVEISDTHVLVNLPTPPTQQARLEELIASLQALAAALEAARRAVPVDPALEPVAAAWSAAPPPPGLTLLPELPALDGEIDGHPVLVRATLGPGGPRAEVRLRFRDHPASGLRLRPQASSKPSPGRQDIVVGDPPFDDAFIVQGYDPTAIRGALGADVRRLLLTLCEGRRLLVDDHTLELFDVDPETAAQAALDAVAVARAFGW